MAAHARKERRAVASGFDCSSEYRRNQIAGECNECAFGPLAAVEGIFAGDAFAPAVYAVAMRGQQDDAAAIGTSETRLEEMDERHFDFAQGDGFNLHIFGEL